MASVRKATSLGSNCLLGSIVVILRNLKESSGQPSMRARSAFHVAAGCLSCGRTRPGTARETVPGPSLAQLALWLEYDGVLGFSLVQGKSTPWR